MQIRELTLDHFRGFEDPRTFELADRFTVFAGVNGRGKTSVLDALAFVLSRLLPLISPARSGYFWVDPDDINGDAPFLTVSIRTNCAGIPLDFWAGYDRETEAVHRQSLPRALQAAVRAAYGDPERVDDASPMAVYYTTDRARRTSVSTSTVVVDRKAAAYRGALLNRTVDYRDFVARFRADLHTEDASIANPNFIGANSVAAMQRALSYFLDGFRNLRIESEPRLRLLVDKDQQTFNIGQLSDGERSFIAMICDLSRRLALANPELANPLEGYGVVLIDEIELHLHPKWQREIVEKLRATFPNIQFVATTHSPFVMQSLRDAKLNVLDEPDSEPNAPFADESIENIAEEIMGVDMPQKSTRYVAMMAAAEKYFRLLRLGRPLSDEAVAAAAAELQELSEPFSDDPAFQALLKVERETTQGGDDAPGQ
jgi:predicted ATP-binding protein involved in virulence